MTGRVNRWTHVAVVFTDLSRKPDTVLYKAELAVYINGVFQDRLQASRRIHVRLGGRAKRRRIRRWLWGATCSA